MHALLIGCDYEGTRDELKGCSKDVLDMNDFLIKRKFKEIKPNHITFKNMETEKHVVVKSDLPIKYIIREE